MIENARIKRQLYRVIVLNEWTGAQRLPLAVGLGKKGLAIREVNSAGRTVGENSTKDCSKSRERRLSIAKGVTATTATATRHTVVSCRG